jgi:hypothetical protein
LALTIIRGFDLKCLFAVNGIQKARRSFGCGTALSGMVALSIIVEARAASRPYALAIGLAPCGPDQHPIKNYEISFLPFGQIS